MHVNSVHTLAGLDERAGGVARSVPGLCTALGRLGNATRLVSQAPRHIARENLLLPEPSWVDTHLAAGYNWERLRASFTPGLGRLLRGVCEKARPCVLHDHGVWLHMNHVAATVASELNLVRVVSPRGMLEAWSLKYRGWKKAAAWHVYQRRDLEQASAFCATSHQEAQAIRALGFRQPVAVIANGIEMPAISDATLRRETNARPDRVAVFMSRLHPKKGLMDLLQAWAAVAPARWRLVIAGPDEDGYGRRIADEICRLNLQPGVSLVGAVAGQVKRDLLTCADLFVLPSYSENFGIVVAEALSYGVPVITTKATPWEVLESAACGWWVDPGVQMLSEALRDATALRDAERAEMGDRGREIVAENYSWESIARSHMQLYHWLLYGGSQPACVAG